MYGHYDDAFVITRSDSDQIVGCFYGEPGKPGWWRGHTRGIVRELFLPGMEPLDVAERFLRGG